MPTRYHGFALALAVLVGTEGAFAQAPNDTKWTVQTPLPGPDFLTITRIHPDGTIVLSPSESVPAQIRETLGTFFAEGLYLVVTNDGQPIARRRVIRAQVTDIAAGSVFTVKTRPEAAARVAVKDSARLIRPMPTTTAQLRALPEEIPLQGEPATANPDDARELAARARSINHLKQIALAMHSYHSTFNTFPPAVIYGPDGKPWHSWRVLILPYIESMELYKAYDFSQPWDSPKNKALIDKMPDVYRDPIHGDTKEPYTHYAALVGPKAAFRPDGAKLTNPQDPPPLNGGLGITSFSDGTSNTVMIGSVEPERKIPWTKPEDIDVGQAFKGFGKPGGIAAPYTFHGPGGGKAAPFLFADGSVRVIGVSIKPAVLAALMTSGSGEVISSNNFNSESLPSVNPVKSLKIRLDGGKATAVIE
jgi:prepilin-type processing-associated H-X9-DG protein